VGIILFIEPMASSLGLGISQMIISENPIALLPNLDKPEPERKIMDKEMNRHGIKIPIALFRVFHFRVQKSFCSLGKNLTC